MMSKRVLIVNKTFPKAGLDLLRNKLQVTVLPYLDYEPDMLPEIKKNIIGIEALIWNTKHRLTKDLIDLAGPQLKAVTTMASGVDHIDVQELAKRGIPLGNTLHSLDNAVADITVGLVIAAARGFKAGIREVESGEWKFGVQWRLGQDIAGSTVGVVGLGGVGQAVVRRLKGFDVARFIYSGRSVKPEATSLGVERVTLDQLLQESDFVILACPFTPETKHLINVETLKLMKRSSVLINIGRGELINQDALYDALKEERIFAAGLDVVTPEPLPHSHPLVSLPNCCIIPHFGSATHKTRDAMATTSAQNILLAMNGEKMVYPVY